MQHCQYEQGSSEPQSLILGRAAPCRKKKNTLPTEGHSSQLNLKNCEETLALCFIGNGFIHVSAAHGSRDSHLTDGWKGTFSWLFLAVCGHSNLLAL